MVVWKDIGILPVTPISSLNEYLREGIMPTAESVQLTAAAYLKGEEASEIKHEYIAGEIWAMVGATDRHVSITMNIAFVLKQALKGKPCQTYMSDMKVRVDTADAYFYPDVMVTCDSRDKENTLSLLLKCCPLLQKPMTGVKNLLITDNCEV